MEYRIVIITGNQRSVLAEVKTEAWAETFKEEVQRWINENHGKGISKVIIEEVRG